MSDILEETTEMEETPTEEIIKIPQRENDFCVISKNTFGKYNVRNIETNSSWGANPYGDDYAIVPDEMVKEIRETRGFCDIELNEDGTEVISFKALEIPEIEQEQPSEAIKEEISIDDMANAILEGINEI